MKTRATSNVHGHVIILTLIVCLLLGLVLVSVISLSTNEGQLTARSQSWNGAIPMAEAGIEEAFTHLKYCPTNRATNGWTLALTGDYYSKGRVMGSARYDVTISTNYDPVITAHGKIRAPNTTNYIVRTVRVMATNEPMFSAAIEATDGIFFKGSGVTINSYDSGDQRFYLPDGRYDSTKFNANGRVICHYGPFELENGKVYGRIETTEESALTLGPNGSVGDLVWHLNDNKGIQQGWHTSTTSSEFSSVEDPGGVGSLPTRVGGIYTLTNGTYRTASLRGSVVVKGGDVRLIVQNDLELNSLIVERGAKIKLYVNAADVALKGIDNKNLRAESFMYFGLAGNRNISLQGNAAFCGILFAPDAALSIGGGGSDEIDFLGAIIARIVTVNGKMTFHFDEATTRLGSRGFIASRWDEL